jgi:mannose-1-phosphate guanylyltransferase
MNREPGSPRTAIILAGGSGTRFWPLSRRSRPKQLLTLEGDRSLLQATVDRLAPLLEPSDVWISTTELLVEAIRAQLPEVPHDHYILEPVGRNTAPALGWALHSLPADRRRGAVVVLPADHRVADAPSFRSALETAIAAAEESDRVLALGVVPRWAETGYGYLELDRSASPTGAPLRRVARFKEKPDRAQAEAFLAAGNYLWNAGIFVFRGDTLLRFLAEFEPELAFGLEALAEERERLAELYPALKSISIDYAVMERLGELHTLGLDCGWSDLGSWAALAEVRPQDGAGNVVEGDVVAIDARDNLLFAEQGTIAVVGVAGLAVVRTADAVLVLPLERAQEVRAILQRLEADRRSERV